MAARHDPDEFDAESWDAGDPDGPQARDISNGDDDETPTVPCPSCRRPVPDFAEKCPYCGDWIVPSAGRPARHSTWFAAAALIALLAFVAWYVF